MTRGSRLTADGFFPRSCVDQRYAQLEQQIFNCHKCTGLNLPKCTEGAPGYGAVPADLMVVGQSLHGYNDATPDRQIPFVGPIKAYDSGILLYHILKKAGYTFANQNLFVTNVVKCHPPNNRSSTHEEMDMCRKYLQKEIILVRPKIIILVGADARRAFAIPQQTDVPENLYAWSYKHHKQKKRFVPLSVWYIGIVHPSAILRFYAPYKKQEYSESCVRIIEKTRRLVNGK